MQRSKGGTQFHLPYHFEAGAGMCLRPMLELRAWSTVGYILWKHNTIFNKEHIQLAASYYTTRSFLGQERSMPAAFHTDALFINPCNSRTSLCYIIPHNFILKEQLHIWIRHSQFQHCGSLKTVYSSQVFWAWSVPTSIRCLTLQEIWPLSRILASLQLAQVITDKPAGKIDLPANGWRFEEHNERWFWNEG